MCADCVVRACCWSHVCHVCPNSYRFAEGDTSILRQKMAREALKAVMAGGLVGLPLELFRAGVHYFQNRGGLGRQRAELSVLLVRTILSFYGKRGPARLEAWFEAHREVERIAKLRALLTIHDEVAHLDGVRGSRELQLFKDYFFHRC